MSTPLEVVKQSKLIQVMLHLPWSLPVDVLAWEYSAFRGQCIKFSRRKRNCKINDWWHTFDLLDAGHFPFAPVWSSKMIGILKLEVRYKALNCRMGVVRFVMPSLQQELHVPSLFVSHERVLWENLENALRSFTKISNNMHRNITYIWAAIEYCFGDSKPPHSNSCNDSQLGPLFWLGFVSITWLNQMDQTDLSGGFAWFKER